VFLFLEFCMQVALSGSIGRAVSTTNTPLSDGSGSAPVSEGVTDWYLLKFADAALVKAAQLIIKGAAVAIVGDLAFEDWSDDDQIRRSKPVVTVSDLQLERSIEFA
jgi:single-stranded DNA-binding protein